MEGFYEALAQEVTGLGIATTLVEPGGFRTDANTRSCGRRAGTTRLCGLARGTAAELLGTHRRPGQAGRSAHHRHQREHPPRRLVLGSGAYEAVHAALAARLAEVEAQRDSASITNYA